MSSQGIQSLTIAPALRVAQRDVTFYLASIKTSDLFKLCSGLRQDSFRDRLIEDEDELSGGTPDETAKHFVAAVSTSAIAADVTKVESDPYSEDEPFQRLVEETRVRKIAGYLAEDFSLIPNSIILALRDSATCVIGSGLAPTLTLEWSEEFPTNIIDGQHRVEALKLFFANDEANADTFFVPVCLLVDLPFYVQAEMFAVINGRQKQVSRSRIYDLLGYMPIKDPETRARAYQGEMAIHRFCHHVVRVLNTSKRSPWHQRIKMRGNGDGVVTQAAFVTDLANLVAPRKDSQRIRRYPVFFRYFIEGDLVGLSKVCVTYFIGVSSAWPSVWSTEGSLSSSLFGKTNGIAVMFLILHDLILLAGGPELLTIQFVKDAWNKAPANRISNPPKGGSRGYQADWYRELMSAMIGEDFAQQVKSAGEKLRPSFREIKALY
jgi:DGQHR domain